jgi:hypothetical protein
MIKLQEYITFKEDTHQYFDPSGNEYTSVSRVIEKIKPSFDKIGISGRMAPARAIEEGISIDQAQELILSEWTAINKSSIVRGNWIHENLEKYMQEGKCDPTIEPTAKQISKFLSKYYRYFPEAILYDSKYQVAGTADLPVQRQKGKNSVFDFWDYKTNEAKGIVYDSIKREKDGSFKKHYNRFLNYPLGHLEDCNYNSYALQLSLYAYMAESTFFVRPGRLGIIFIDDKLKIKIIPVPYLKLEAIALLDHFKSLNKSDWED